MTRFFGALLALAFVFGLVGASRAADATAILDKAIQALGGEEKLSKLNAVTYKAKGTITFMGNDNAITTQTTIQGLDHLRSEFEGEFGGNKITGVTVINGDKGWRKFGDQVMEMDKDAIANEKRTIYLSVVPMTVVPLKGKGFKVEVVGEEKVGGKDTAVLKVTPADGKDFKIFFDKDTGLPVQTVAKVMGFMGEEFTQQTTYGDYKEVGGIKKAMKSEAKRDGEKFIDQQLTEFKVLDKVDAKTFAEPQ
jgi:outer membrane lipoprotein-sorting protein